MIMNIANDLLNIMFAFSLRACKYSHNKKTRSNTAVNTTSQNCK